jgi:CheY-like chemotaxis protein
MILLVDDEHCIREILEECLLEEGFRVLCAGNGAEALRLLPNLQQPCVIILDLMMPIMDGREFLAQIGGHPTWSRHPILLTSASFLRHQPAELPSGISAWLPKPLELSGLLSTLRRLLASAPAEP